MSIKYDPDLEGSILPNIVYDGKPVKLKQRLDAKTQKYLRDYLIKSITSSEQMDEQC